MSANQLCVGWGSPGRKMNGLDGCPKPKHRGGSDATAPLPARRGGAGPRLALAALLVSAALCSVPVPAAAQVSRPISHDHIITKDVHGTDASNKFLERKASPDSFDDEAGGFSALLR